MNVSKLAAATLGSLLLVAAPQLCGADPAALADAAERADRAQIRALLQEHVDANVAQVDGMTALHWAAYHDDLETAKRLIAAGASAKAANRYGVTPLSLACTNGNRRSSSCCSTAGPIRTPRSPAARRP